MAEAVSSSAQEAESAVPPCQSPCHQNWKSTWYSPWQRLPLEVAKAALQQACHRCQSRPCQRTRSACPQHPRADVPALQARQPATWRTRLASASQAAHASRWHPTLPYASREKAVQPLGVLRVGHGESMSNNKTNQPVERDSLRRSENTWKMSEKMTSRANHDADDIRDDKTNDNHICFIDKPTHTHANT